MCATDRRHFWPFDRGYTNIIRLRCTPPPPDDEPIQPRLSPLASTPGPRVNSQPAQHACNHVAESHWSRASVAGSPNAWTLAAFPQVKVSRVVPAKPVEMFGFGAVVPRTESRFGTFAICRFDDRIQQAIAAHSVTDQSRENDGSQPHRPTNGYAAPLAPGAQLLFDSHRKGEHVSVTNPESAT